MMKAMKKVTNEVNDKMLIRTNQAAASGQGTAMHSKTGISTIPMYMIYREQNDRKQLDKINSDEAELVQQFRDNKLLLTLTMAENELYNQTVGTDPDAL